MMRDEQQPTVEKLDGYAGRESKTEHPAFGTVSVTRTTGQAQLFDSEFKHQHYITLRINKAYAVRSLSQSWIHGRDTKVEVAMSEAQWATMLSSMNLGSGTPCTIQRMNGESIPRIIAGDTERMMHVNEFDNHMEEVYTRIDDLMNEVADAKMSIKLRNKLLSMANSIRTAAGPNMKFVAKSFSEHMETTIEHAKIEIASYANRSGVVDPPMLGNDSQDAIEDKSDNAA